MPRLLVPDALCAIDDDRMRGDVRVLDDYSLQLTMLAVMSLIAALTSCRARTRLPPRSFDAVSSVRAASVSRGRASLTRVVGEAGVLEPGDALAGSTSKMAWLTRRRAFTRTPHLSVGAD